MPVTDDDLDALLSTLSDLQLRFVKARLGAQSDAEAAEEIGIAAGTVYNWPNKEAVRAAVQLARKDAVAVAAERLRRLSNVAVDVYVEALEGEESVGVARDVLDRVMGRPTQRTEVSGRGGGPIEYKDVSYTDDQRAEIISRLLDRARERAAGSDAES